MPTNFPTSVDNFTNPTANDSLNLPSHSTQHANANDAIEAIETSLLPAGVNYTGLVHLNTTTFTSQTTVNIDNVFTSTYRNYRIVVAITGTNSNPQIQGQFRSGGTSTVGTAYLYGFTNISSTNSASTTAQNGGGSFLFNFASSVNPNQHFIMDLTNPQVNTRTLATLQIMGYDGGIFVCRNGGLIHDAIAQFDGISILTGDPAKNITGEVSIYGYRK